MQGRRIRLGAPAFPDDLDPESLPAEAGWDSAPVTDRTKGCFLGQEAVAKIANRGHPTRLVRAVLGDRPLTAGEPVLAGDGPVGLVTSADGAFGLVRIAWRAREEALSTSSGVRLSTR